jgi:hypothetical protein
MTDGRSNGTHNLNECPSIQSDSPSFATGH